MSRDTGLPPEFPDRPAHGAAGQEYRVGQRYLYTAADEIGHGGMGVVYRAYDRLTGSHVALKKLTETDESRLISSPGHPDPSGRRALAAEFAIQAGLRHPCLATVLDYGFDESGYPFYTMALLEGAQSILDAGRGTSPALWLRWILQGCSALAYLHRRGVVHRDLSPHNLVVVRGDLVLLDFGLAESAQVALRAALAGADWREHPYGAVGSLAPEQISPTTGTGLQAEYLPQTDLYQLGVIAFTLFAGRPPFSADTLPELLAQIISAEPDARPLIAYPRMAEAILRMLAKRPADRYPSAEVAMTALHEVALSSSDLVQAIAQTRLYRAFHPFPTRADLTAGDTLGTASGNTAAQAPDGRDFRSLQEPPFVGRADALKTFDLAIESACERHGSIWAIEGNAGIGKSRLLEQVRLMGLAHGLIVASGQASSEERDGSPVWLGVLRALALYAPLDGTDTAILRDLVPDIEALLGTPAAAIPLLGAEAAQIRLAVTVSRMLGRLVTPALIILEDLHWAGEESLGLLDRLIPSLSQSPVLIAVSGEPDTVLGRLMNLPAPQRITLTPLAEAEAEALIEELARVGIVRTLPDPATRAALFTHAEGNPLHLIALAQRFDANRKTDLTAAAARQRSTMLSGALRRMTPEERDALRLAAAFGLHLDQAVLARLCGADQVRGWIEGWSDAGLIEWHAGQWRFRHDSLRSAILEQTPPADLRAIHGRVAAALSAAVHEPGSPIRPARLAYHWRLAGDMPREQAASIAAGRDALRTGSAQAAMDYFQRALQIADQAGAPLPAQEQVEVTRSLGQCAIALGHFEQASGYLQMALAALHRSLPLPRSQTREAAWYAGALLRQAWHRLRLPVPIAAADPRTEFWRSAAALYEYSSLVEFYNGRWQGASLAAIAMLNATERIAPGPERVRAVGIMVVMLCASPFRRFAPAYLGYLTQISAQVGDPLAEAAALRAALPYATGSGLWAIAEAQASRAQEASRAALDFRLWGDATAHLSRAAYFQGDLDRALALAEELGRIARLSGTIHQQASAWDYQGSVYMLRGDYERAVAHFERAAALFAGATPVEQSMRGLTYAALARCTWELGAFARSDALLDRLHSLLFEVPTLLYSNMEDLSFYADGLRQRLEGGQDRGFYLKRLEATVRLLSRRARTFPIAEPKAAYWAGVLAAARGDAPGAVAAWQACLSRAASLGMRPDMMVAHAALSRADIPPTLRAEHRAEAVALARAMRLAPELAQLSVAADDQG